MVMEAVRGLGESTWRLVGLLSLLEILVAASVAPILSG